MLKSAVSLFESLSVEIDPQLLQRRFLLSLLELQNVSRGSIWIKNEDQYLCIEAAGVESERIRGVAIDAKLTSIVGWVIENGEMTISEPNTDNRHYHELERELAVKSSLILCFPLFLRDRRVYGAVQIIDTTPEKSRINLNEEYLSHLQDLVNIGSIALGNAIFYNDQLKEAAFLKQTLQQIRSEGVILGQSPTFLKFMDLIRSYAVTDYPVLITGESGTGKELAANRVHELSNRRERPFVVQNCSAIPESLLESELFGHSKGSFSGAIADKVGLFEAAEGGTVFLDEIGDMPMSLQAKILRVIQNSEIKPLGQVRTKKVDIRIISATNKNIQEEVAKSIFRQDLYYRLSVLPLHLPPLRERREDISLLFRHFMKREALKMGLPAKSIDREAMLKLIDYAWVGNIRELENLVRYLLVVSDGDTIIPSDLPFIFDEVGQAAISGDPVPMPALSAPAPGASSSAPGAIPYGDMTWADVEASYVNYLLQRNSGNITLASQDAGLNRSTFVSRMRRLGIQRQS